MNRMDYWAGQALLSELSDPRPRQARSLDGEPDPAGARRDEAGASRERFR